MNNDINTKLNRLKISLFVSIVYAVVVLLSVYILYETYRLAKINALDDYQKARLNALTKFVAIMFILVSLFFVYQTYISYCEKPNKTQKGLLIAAFLDLIVSGIDYYSVNDKNLYDNLSI